MALQSAFLEVTLYRALEMKLYILKLARDYLTDDNSERIKDQQLHYAQRVRNIGINLERIYVDETEFNLWTWIAYGRSRIRTLVKKIIAVFFGRNATVFKALFGRHRKRYCITKLVSVL